MSSGWQLVFRFRVISTWGGSEGWICLAWASKEIKMFEELISTYRMLQLLRVAERSHLLKQMQNKMKKGRPCHPLRTNFPLLSLSHISNKSAISIINQSQNKNKIKWWIFILSLHLWETFYYLCLYFAQGFFHIVQIQLFNVITENHRNFFDLLHLQHFTFSWFAGLIILFFFFGLFVLQRVSEKVGGAEGTKLDDDFTEMEKARLHSHVHIITLLFNNFQKLLHLLSKLCWTNMDHLKRTLL